MKCVIWFGSGFKLELALPRYVDATSVYPKTILAWVQLHSADALNDKISNLMAS